MISPRPRSRPSLAIFFCPACSIFSFTAVFVVWWVYTHRDTCCRGGMMPYQRFRIACFSLSLRCEISYASEKRHTIWSPCIAFSALGTAWTLGLCILNVGHRQGRKHMCFACPPIAVWAFTHTGMAFGIFLKVPAASTNTTAQPPPLFFKTVLF